MKLAIWVAAVLAAAAVTLLAAVVAVAWMTQRERYPLAAVPEPEPEPDSHRHRMAARGGWAAYDAQPYD